MTSDSIDPIQLLVEDLKPGERVLLIGGGEYLHDLSRGEFLAFELTMIALLSAILGSFWLCGPFTVAQCFPLIAGTLFTIVATFLVILWNRRRPVINPPDNLDVFAVTNQRLIGMGYRTVSTIATENQVNRMTFSEAGVRVYFGGNQLLIVRNEPLFQELGKELLEYFHPEKPLPGGLVSPPIRIGS